MDCSTKPHFYKVFKLPAQFEDVLFGKLTSNICCLSPYCAAIKRHYKAIKAMSPTCQPVTRYLPPGLTTFLGETLHNTIRLRTRDHSSSS